MASNDLMKQFVYWLSPVHEYTFGQKDNRSITMWARTPEEGLKQLADWKDRGYTVKFLYSMDDFKARRERDFEEERKLKEIEAFHAKHATKIEVENV